MADINGSVTDPGLGGVFETLAPLFEPGYHIVFRPDIEATQPASPPAFSDPRGILPANLVPASTLSYELFDSVHELVVPQRITASAAFITVNQVAGQVTINSQAFISLVVFEGKDVVDLPTAGLPTVNGGIQVPDLVFLPIHAGGKFIQSPTDDFGTKASLAYIHRSNGNAVRGMVPSASPPLDSFANSKSIIPNTGLFPVIDVASNIIKIDGAAEFISYVAATKPLFRDVVTLSSSAIAQGVFVGDNLNISFVGPFGTPQVQVLRYAFIATGNALQPFQWRLSESFGIQIDKKQETPPDLIAGSADLSEKEALHFVYDLSDASQDIGTVLPFKPIKTGYSPALATAKTDSTSRYFDKNFKAQIVPSDQFFFQSRLQVKRIFGLTGPAGSASAANRIETDRTYVSPLYKIDVGNNTRMGLEYAVHRFSRTNAFEQDDLILLAAAKEGIAGGISTFYDPCMKRTFVYSVENNTVAQRIFNDKTWAIAPEQPPRSKLKAFLIGESPSQSAGPAAIGPTAKSTFVGSGEQGDVTIPASLVVVAVSVNTGGLSDENSAPILELYAKKGGQGTPIFEVAISGASDSTVLISIPSIDFASFKISNANGVSVNKFYGVEKTFLPAMVPPAATENADLDKLNAQQFSQNKAETFPLQISRVSAANLSTYGASYLAYNNNGRIDLAYRSALSGVFGVMRDICLRIPDGQVPGQASNNKNFYPPAENPFLIVAQQTSSLLLFYTYKDRLLMKNIPYWMFPQEQFETIPLPAETESRLSAAISRLFPSVVYDGNIANPSDGIKSDISFSAIKIPEKPAIAGTKAQIVQHSACRTSGGHIFCFVQDGNRIRARRSTDNGQTWVDIFSNTTTFLPSTTTDQASLSDADAPYCYYDISSQTVLLFFIADNSLLCMIIPEHVLLLEQSEADEAIKTIHPEVIYGSLSSSLESRGIGLQSTVLERKTAAQDNFKETINPHLISAIRLDGGHIRVFFLDSQKVLRSLISSNDGKLWQSEDQYLSNG